MIFNVEIAKNIVKAHILNTFTPFPLKNIPKKRDSNIKCCHPLELFKS